MVCKLCTSRNTCKYWSKICLQNYYMYMYMCTISSHIVPTLISSPATVFCKGSNYSVDHREKSSIQGEIMAGETTLFTYCKPQSG